MVTGGPYSKMTTIVLHPAHEHMPGKVLGKTEAEYGAWHYFLWPEISPKETFDP
jgi:hypothetical protein